MFGFPARWTLATVGLAFVGIAGITRLMPVAAEDSPGKLVAAEDSLIWQSPISGEETQARSVQFDLVNKGGVTVNILAVTSGCGCARPRVEPRVVPPGEAVAVSVDPTPMQYGERNVAIEVRTDSPETPIVPLTLRIVGSQRPPFLLAVDGDLTFRDPAAGDSREIAITTIELEGSRESPEIRCDPPFLQIVPIDVQAKPRLDDPGVVLKVARYRMEFNGTPQQPHQGEVIVRDPWVLDRELRLLTRVEVTPPLRAVPSRLVLRPGSKKSSETLHVFARGSASHEAITMEPASTDSPLRVEEVGEDREGESRAFLVSWEENSPLEEETHHLVIREPSGAYELTIPVRIEPGGAR